MKRLEINLTTGEKKEVSLTPSELAEKETQKEKEKIEQQKFENYKNTKKNAMNKIASICSLTNEEKTTLFGD